MVAPIAIVSYIDPKESISNGKLNSWIKECVTTYLSLFLRLATIYLIMFVVSLIASTVISNGTNVGGLLSQDTSYNIWVYLFLVIGAFMFAKQVPNIIEKIFGIKGSGELHLNPFKNAGAAALIGGVAGAGLSSVASGISAFNTSKSNKESTGTALMRGLGGAGGGLLRGVYDGATAKNLADVGRRSMTNAGIAARNASIARGTNMFGRTAARARNAFGMPSRKEIMDQGIDQRETVSKHISNIDKYMEGELAKKSDLWKNIQAQRTRYEQLRAEGKISAQEYTDFNNQAFSDEKALKRMFYEAGGITDANGNLLRDKNGKLVFGVDGYLTQDKASVLEEARDIGIDIKDINNWNEIDQIAKDIKLDVYTTRSSDEYRDATRYDQVVKREAGQRHVNH